MPVIPNITVLPEALADVFTTTSDSSTFGNMTNNSSLESSTGEDYNSSGAAWFLVAVILVYAAAIIFLIGSLSRRSENRETDKKVHEYMDKLEDFRYNVCKDKLKIMKMKYIDIPGPSRENNESSSETSSDYDKFCDKTRSARDRRRLRQEALRKKSVRETQKLRLSRFHSSLTSTNEATVLPKYSDCVSDPGRFTNVNGNLGRNDLGLQPGSEINVQQLTEALNTIRKLEPALLELLKQKETVSDYKGPRDVRPKSDSCRYDNLAFESIAEDTVIEGDSVSREDSKSESFSETGLEDEVFHV